MRHRTLPRPTRATARAGAIVIAPTWPISGSTQVFKGQLKTLSKLGFETYLLAVPDYDFGWREQAAAMHEYRTWTTDLPANRRGEGRFVPLVCGLRRRAFARAQAPPAYQKAECASLISLPKDLRAFVGQCERLFVLCNHFFNVPAVERLEALTRRDIDFVLETHDVQSRHYWRRGECRDEATYLSSLAAEMEFVARASACVHICETDADVFRSALPHKPHVVIMPSLEQPGQVRGEGRELDLTFLIVSSWNEENAESLNWFFHEVWTHYAGGGTLAIIGRVGEIFASRYPDTFARWRHCFVGRVENLDRWYRAARCVLLPVLAGEGIAIKFAEAMAYGKRVLYTPQAVRGLPREIIAPIAKGRCGTAAEFLTKMDGVPTSGPAPNSGASSRIYRALFHPARHVEAYAPLVERYTNRL